MTLTTSPPTNAASGRVATPRMLASPGSHVAPTTMTLVAASAAPPDTPVSDGSASGFRSRRHCSTRRTQAAADNDGQQHARQADGPEHRLLLRGNAVRRGKPEPTEQDARDVCGTDRECTDAATHDNRDNQQSEQCTEHGGRRHAAAMRLTQRHWPWRMIGWHGRIGRCGETRCRRVRGALPQMNLR